ncbi:Phospholipase_D-nuclease N-terminal [Micromonospora pallida]|uniref:Phospholipase_D-nuclease N-terminal n=1 Tax=Micromonospora pallida TaxID=145854 RepID=A0A1C6SYW8_9ACTN|nr:PLDc N-terminal domain-containing protein [Micromonospora pallida]SCL34325.1 Phospholipase_D-nuclease N-terminal [Micromonospora pallida]
MVRVFLFLLVVHVVLAALSLIDCLSAEKHQVRALPRAVWVPVLLLVPLLGPAAWFLAGRPASTGRAHPAAPPRRPAAPDDDPDFLRSIAESARRQDEELFRRWEDDLRRREDDLRRERDLGPADDQRDPDRTDTPDRRPDPDQTS